MCVKLSLGRQQKLKLNTVNSHGQVSANGDFVSDDSWVTAAEDQSPDLALSPVRYPGLPVSLSEYCTQYLHAIRIFGIILRVESLGSQTWKASMLFTTLQADVSYPSHGCLFHV